MKSKILLSLALSVSVMGAIAQKNNVGIGTTKPDQSAALEVSSTTQGFLPPRVTLQQRNSIQNPATGLMVYQSDFLAGTYQFDGKEWKTLGVSAATNSVADANNWGLLGNSGTLGTTNFIGTTDNQPLVIKVNSFRSGYVGTGTTQNTFLGFQAGNTGAITGIANSSLGVNSLQNIAGGSFNMALGVQALQNNTSGSSNVAIGTNSMALNSSGDANLAIGSNALLSNVSGNLNIAIGSDAGRLSTGSGNLFVGYQAGYNETGSNKLYISNTNTTTPLVYGDFTAKYLAVGEVTDADRAVGGSTSDKYRLIVKGGMITEKIKVAVAGSLDWSDYVFEKNYKIMPLEQVERFVQDNKHLPNMPSADEMVTNGLDVMKTSAKLLEKIEELTLYIIDLNKKIKQLELENSKR